MTLSLALAFSPDALAGAKVSAFKAESKLGANYWSGASAIDGKQETAWMVPGESENRGEWIEFDLPKGEVDKLGVMPGWNKNEETFGDYPRVKSLRVDIFDLDDDQNPKQVGTATVTVSDKREWQILELPDTKVGNTGLFGGKVRISIVDIYDGQDFPNLGVSEVLVYLKEWDAAAKIASASASIEGHGPDLATDANPKTFWAGPAGAEFDLATSGYGLGSVGFVGGVKDYSRPKTIEVTANGRTITTVLADKADAQSAPVPGFFGYTGGGDGEVKVKIVDTYQGKNPEVAVSELKFNATCREEL